MKLDPRTRLAATAAGAVGVEVAVHLLLGQVTLALAAFSGVLAVGGLPLLKAKLGAAPKRNRPAPALPPAPSEPPATPSPVDDPPVEEGMHDLGSAFPADPDWRTEAARTHEAIERLTLDLAAFRETRVAQDGEASRVADEMTQRLDGLAHAVAHLETSQDAPALVHATQALTARTGDVLEGLGTLRDTLEGQLTHHEGALLKRLDEARAALATPLSNVAQTLHALEARVQEHERRVEASWKAVHADLDRLRRDAASAQEAIARAQREGTTHVSHRLDALETTLTQLRDTIPDGSAAVGAVDARADAIDRALTQVLDTLTRPKGPPSDEETQALEATLDRTLATAGERLAASLRAALRAESDAHRHEMRRGHEAAARSARAIQRASQVRHDDAMYRTGRLHADLQRAAEDARRRHEDALGAIASLNERLSADATFTQQALEAQRRAIAHGDDLATQRHEALLQRADATDMRLDDARATLDGHLDAALAALAASHERHAERAEEAAEGRHSHTLDRLDGLATRLDAGIQRAIDETQTASRGSATSAQAHLARLDEIRSASQRDALRAHEHYHALLGAAHALGQGQDELAERLATHAAATKRYHENQEENAERRTNRLEDATAHSTETLRNILDAASTATQNEALRAHERHHALLGATHALGQGQDELAERLDHRTADLKGALAKEAARALARQDDLVQRLRAQAIRAEAEEHRARERHRDLTEATGALSRGQVELGTRLDARAEHVAALVESASSQAKAAHDGLSAGVAGIVERCDALARSIDAATQKAHEDTLALHAGQQELGDRVDARAADVTTTLGEISEALHEVHERLEAEAAGALTRHEHLARGADALFHRLDGIGREASERGLRTHALLDSVAAEARAHASHADERHEASLEVMGDLARDHETLARHIETTAEAARARDLRTHELLDALATEADTQSRHASQRHEAILDASQAMARGQDALASQLGERIDATAGEAARRDETLKSLVEDALSDVRAEAERSHARDQALLEATHGVGHSAAAFAQRLDAAIRDAAAAAAKGATRAETRADEAAARDAHLLTRVEEAADEARSEARHARARDEATRRATERLDRAQAALEERVGVAAAEAVERDGKTHALLEAAAAETEALRRGQAELADRVDVSAAGAAQRDAVLSATIETALAESRAEARRAHDRHEGLLEAAHALSRSQDALGDRLERHIGDGVDRTTKLAERLDEVADEAAEREQRTLTHLDAMATEIHGEARRTRERHELLLNATQALRQDQHTIGTRLEERVSDVAGAAAKLAARLDAVANEASRRDERTHARFDAAEAEASAQTRRHREQYHGLLEAARSIGRAQDALAAKLDEAGEAQREQGTHVVARIDTLAASLAEGREAAEGHARRAGARHDEVLGELRALAALQGNVHEALGDLGRAIHLAEEHATTEAKARHDDLLAASTAQSGRLADLHAQLDQATRALAQRSVEIEESVHELNLHTERAASDAREESLAARERHVGLLTRVEETTALAHALRSELHETAAGADAHHRNMMARLEALQHDGAQRAQRHDAALGSVRTRLDEAITETQARLAEGFTGTAASMAAIARPLMDAHASAAETALRRHEEVTARLNASEDAAARERREAAARLRSEMTFLSQGLNARIGALEDGLTAFSRTHEAGLETATSAFEAGLRAVAEEARAEARLSHARHRDLLTRTDRTESALASLAQVQAEGDEAIRDSIQRLREGDAARAQELKMSRDAMQTLADAVATEARTAQARHAQATAAAETAREDLARLDEALSQTSAEWRGGLATLTQALHDADGRSQTQQDALERRLKEGFARQRDEAKRMQHALDALASANATSFTAVTTAEKRLGARVSELGDDMERLRDEVGALRQGTQEAHAVLARLEGWTAEVTERHERATGTVRADVAALAARVDATVEAHEAKLAKRLLTLERSLTALEGRIHAEANDARVKERVANLEAHVALLATLPSTKTPEPEPRPRRRRVVRKQAVPEPQPPAPAPAPSAPKAETEVPPPPAPQKTPEPAREAPPQPAEPVRETPPAPTPRRRYPVFGRRA